MRVLHVISSVAPRYGGPSAAVRGMASATAARGLDVTVVTTDADGPHRLAPRYEEPVVEDGVSYRYFRRAPFSKGWHFSWPLTRWLYQSIRHFDVVEAHALFTYTTLPSSRLAARAGVPYVVRPLGTLGKWSLEQKRWMKKPYYSLIERPTLAAAAAIHVTADSEAAEVRALGFGDKARVIPLGVAMTPAPRATVGESGRLRLLFLSRVHPKKGLELLFAALGTLRARGERTGITLTVAGDGEASYLESLGNEAAHIGIAGDVKFVGALQGEAKRIAFADADAFVLTSHNENFGIAAAEALAAGLPVILSEEVGLSAEVRAADAGIIVPLQPEAIAAAIVRMRDNASARAEMGRRAWRLANERFSWAECGRRLAALYGELASRGS